jgi:hypothetical protein
MENTSELRQGEDVYIGLGVVGSTRSNYTTEAIDTDISALIVDAFSGTHIPKPDGAEGQQHGTVQSAQEAEIIHGSIPGEDGNVRRLETGIQAMIPPEELDQQWPSSGAKPLELLQNTHVSFEGNPQLSESRQDHLVPSIVDSTQGNDTAGPGQPETTEVIGGDLDLPSTMMVIDTDMGGWDLFACHQIDMEKDLEMGRWDLFS